MYNDKKYPNDWKRGRRPEFTRDDRYQRRENFTYQPYSPTKRRKLENGDAEPLQFDNQRRGYAPPTYDSRRNTVARPFYPREQFDRPTGFPKNGTFYPTRDYRQYQTDPMRRQGYPMEHLQNEQRPPEIYQRKYSAYDQPNIGKKRLRHELTQSPSRFVRREYDTRQPILTPTNNLPSNKIVQQEQRDTYSQSPNLTMSMSSTGNITPNASTVSPDTKIINTPSSDSDDESTLSKVQIIQEMDNYDTEIGTVEEEIEEYKILKNQCQRNTDKSKLSLVDKILVTNQEIASDNSDFIKLFQQVDVTHKTKAAVVHNPDNSQLHILKKPAMINHMRKSLLKVKEKNKNLVEEYRSKWKKWNTKLLENNIHPPKPLLPFANAISTEVTPVEIIGGPKGRRSRTSANVRNDAQMTQVMEQINENDNLDPNTRYLKTLAKIPSLITDPKEKNRRFIDNNRYVKDCSAEYRTFRITNPWNTEEQNIFFTKYLNFPKQFGKIASYLPNKSIEEVICYYFTNKHRLNLKAEIQKLRSKKRTHRVRATRKAPSTLSNNNNNNNNNSNNDISSNHDSNYWIISSNTKERVTRSRVQKQKFDNGKQAKERPVRNKQIQKTKKTKQIATTPTKKYRPVQAVGAVQLCFCNNAPTSWNDVEVKQFKHAFNIYGSDFKAIADYISTKNHWQCRSFYFNFSKQLQLEGIVVKKKLKLSSNSTDTVIDDSNTKSPLNNSSIDKNDNDFPNINNSSPLLTDKITNSTNIDCSPKSLEYSDSISSQNWTLDNTTTNSSNNYRSSFIPLSTSSMSPVVIYSEESRKALRTSLPNINNTFDNNSTQNNILSQSIDSISPLENINTANSVDWKMDENISTNSVQQTSTSEVNFPPIINSNSNSPLKINNNSLLIKKENSAAVLPNIDSIPVQSNTNITEINENIQSYSNKPLIDSPLSIVNKSKSDEKLTTIDTNKSFEDNNTTDTTKLSFTANPTEFETTITTGFIPVSTKEDKDSEIITTIESGAVTSSNPFLEQHQQISVIKNNSPTQTQTDSTIKEITNEQKNQSPTKNEISIPPNNYSPTSSNIIQYTPTDPQINDNNIIENEDSFEVIQEQMLESGIVMPTQQPIEESSSTSHNNFVFGYPTPISQNMQQGYNINNINANKYLLQSYNTHICEGDIKGISENNDSIMEDSDSSLINNNSNTTPLITRDIEIEDIESDDDETLHIMEDDMSE